MQSYKNNEEERRKQIMALTEIKKLNRKVMEEIEAKMQSYKNNEERRKQVMALIERKKLDQKVICNFTLKSCCLVSLLKWLYAFKFDLMLTFMASQVNGQLLGKAKDEVEAEMQSYSTLR